MVTHVDPFQHHLFLVHPPFLVVGHDDNFCFIAVFLLKMSMGGNLSPAAQQPSTTVKLAFLCPVVWMVTDLLPSLSTVVVIGMSKVNGISSIFMMWSFVTSWSVTVVVTNCLKETSLSWPSAGSFWHIVVLARKASDLHRRKRLIQVRPPRNAVIPNSSVMVVAFRRSWHVLTPRQAALWVSTQFSNRSSNCAHRGLNPCQLFCFFHAL